MVTSVKPLTVCYRMYGQGQHVILYYFFNEAGFAKCD